MASMETSRAEWLPWEPATWLEFRQIHAQGLCSVSFCERVWSWDGLKRLSDTGFAMGVGTALLYALVAGVCLVAIGRLLTLPWWLATAVSLTAALRGFGSGSEKRFRRSFTREMLSNEDFFWSAYRESGIDIMVDPYAPIILPRGPKSQEQAHTERC